MKIFKGKNAGPLLVVIGLSCLYWLLDAVFNQYSDSGVNFINELVQPEPLPLLRRMVVFGCLVCIWAYTQTRHKSLETALIEYKLYNQTLLRNNLDLSLNKVAPVLDTEKSENIQKVFFELPQKVDFTCRACKEERSVLVSPAITSSGKLAVSGVCECGQQFDVRPDMRRSDRCPVSFPGVYMHRDLTGEREVNHMHVSNISRFGLQMEVLEKHNLAPGDIVDLFIKFEAETAKSIKKSAVVKTVGGATLGTKFIAAFPPASPLDKYLE